MNNLKKERLKNKLTQKQAAESIGISYSMLSKVETDNKVPSKETMEKFANFYSKTVDYLFFESSTTESEEKGNYIKQKA